MLPGFCEHFQMYKIFNDFLKTYPEAKRKNAEIYCYYGNIPFCSWDGGRIFNSYSPLSKDEIKEIQNYYNNVINSKVRFVFTNNLLEQKHCYDRYNNLSLSIFHNSNNEIVINSDILMNYIQDNYPNYSFISSTTKCLTKIDDAISELNNNNYKFTCLDYNLNHNWKFLDSLTPEEKEKTEFLINPICGPGCLQRKEHYRLNSLFSLSYGVPYHLKSCEIHNSSLCPNANKTVITAEEIYTTYLPKGFKYFKLEGRTHSSLEIAAFIAEYIIEPKYQNFFLVEIYRTLGDLK